MWAHAPWRGTVYPRQAKSSDFLALYAQTFNAVEGNSSFYALPTATQVANWKAATPTQFRFCFKFPRVITHDSSLRNCEPQLQQFLARMAPLEQRLGPLMIQLGPNFAPAHLPDLAQFLTQLSAEFRYAVEVRHPAFFADDAADANLNALLAQHQVARCHFDTVCLHRARTQEKTTLEAQHKKPKSPRRASITAGLPLIRLVGQNDLSAIEPDLEFWAPTLTNWLAAGMDCYFFTHTPDDLYAPSLAKRVYQSLAMFRPDLPALRSFEEPEPFQAKSRQQGFLF